MQKFIEFSMYPIFILSSFVIVLFFFFNDTATTEIYTLSLHDALPIYTNCARMCAYRLVWSKCSACFRLAGKDRKSTRLNSSHQIISYAVFCLKKKKKQQMTKNTR